MAERQDFSLPRVEDGEVRGEKAVGVMLQQVAPENGADTSEAPQRKQFVILMSQLAEPARGQLHAHHEQAVIARMGQRFIRVLMTAVEGRSPRERREYLTYVAMLKWDRSHRDLDGCWYHSVLRELAELERAPATVPLRRPEPLRDKMEKRIEQWADEGDGRGRAREGHGNLHSWRTRVKRWIGSAS